MCKILAALICTTLVTTSAVAGAQRMGWYKPGVGYAQFERDWRACESLAQVRGPSSDMNNPGGFTYYSGMMAKKCMTSKGYVKARRGFNA
jgi:hypothetical protein